MPPSWPILSTLGQLSIGQLRPPKHPNNQCTNLATQNPKQTNATNAETLVPNAYSDTKATYHPKQTSIQSNLAPNASNLALNTKQQSTQCYSDPKET